MTIETSGTTATTTNSGAGEGTGDGGGGIRQSAADAYQSARDRTASAYAAARDSARSATQRTAERIDTNPMAAVVGGLALGAIAGALLPRTQREEELLGPVGRRITDTAKEASRAARDASRQQLDDFTDRAVGALRSSASAAAESVRSKGNR
ncbi:MAG TPA: hypothetical protein VF727_09685 [Allosphingosinicella sp.]|jgi:ElaB/YqjD/DUF883 family membrane-anchored ribosome-binding protein